MKDPTRTWRILRKIEDGLTLVIWIVVIQELWDILRPHRRRPRASAYGSCTPTTDTPGSATSRRQRRQTNEDMTRWLDW